MGSEAATPKAPTRLELTRIPDSWAWMRPDIFVRLLPFTAAFVAAYLASGRAGWLGLGAGRLGAQLGFAAIAAPLMFAAAGALQRWLTRRRGGLLGPARADEALVRAAVPACHGS